MLVQNTRIEDSKSLELAVEILGSSSTPSLFNSRVGRNTIFLNRKIAIQNKQGLTAANYLIRHKNGHMATEGLIALVENGFDFREKDKFGKTLEELIPMCQAMSCKQIDKVQSVIWNKKDYSEMKKDCAATNKEAQDEILEEKLQEIYEREDTPEIERKPRRKLSLLQSLDDTPVDMRNSKHEQFEDDIPSRRSTFHDSGGSYDGDNYSEQDLEEDIGEDDSLEDLIEIIEEDPIELKSSTPPPEPEPEPVPTPEPKRKQEVLKPPSPTPIQSIKPQPKPIVEKPRIAITKETPPQKSAVEPPPVPEPKPVITELQKAVEGACGRMNEENKITSGPLQSREKLKAWIHSINFQGNVIDMFHKENLFHPRDWLGGGKCAGKLP